MIFKFKCEQCGEKELMLPSSQGNLDTCPDCGSKMTRIFSGLIGIFKCDGDYNRTKGER